MIRRGLSQRWPELWLALWFGAALLARMLPGPWGSDLTDHTLNRTLLPPDLPLHLAGFDAFGRDVLGLTLYASLASSAVALAIAGGAILLGWLAGAALAVSGRWLQFLFARSNDLWLAFPALLLALAWAAARGPGWDTLVVAMGVGVVPQFIRLMHARARELVSEEYVLAAQALGSSPWRLITRHVGPGLLPLCEVKLPSLFAHALLAEATLSFLGIGAPLGQETWGLLLAQGKEYLIEAPHIAVGSGVPLALTVMALMRLSERRSEKVLRR